MPIDRWRPPKAPPKALSKPQQQSFWDEDEDAAAWDIVTRRPLYDDPDYEDAWEYFARRPRRLFRPVDCVCGEQLRYLMGEYVHYYDGHYTRRCKHLDFMGRL